jgi:glycerol kinase
MSAYILALDQGTTSSRAMLFDRDGSPVSQAHQEFPQIFPHPGWVEHNPEEIWSSQEELYTDWRQAVSQAKEWGEKQVLTHIRKAGR